MKDFKVAVIGAGLMGGGIAQTCAQAGYEGLILISMHQLLIRPGLILRSCLTGR